MAVSIRENKNSDLVTLEGQWDLIKKMYCRDLTEDEIAVFFAICKRTGLNPIQRHIYPIKYRGALNTVTGIDGFRLIAERSGKYSPGKAPDFSYDDQKRLVSATSYVKKMTDDGTWHEVSAVVFLEEYKPAYAKPDSTWAKMPRVMLSKCAEAMALRKAFPADLAGLYSPEEMEQANDPVVDIPAIAENQPSEKKQNGTYQRPIDPRHVTDSERDSAEALFQKLSEADQRAVLAYNKIPSIYALPPEKFDGAVTWMKKAHDNYQRKTA